MRILNFSLAIIFLIFAFLQVDDPDAALWILIYGFVAVLNFLAIFRIYPVKVIGAGMLLFAVYLAFLFPEVLNWLKEEDKSVLFDQMQTEKPYIEGSREFFGLLLALFVLIFLFISALKYKKRLS